MADDGLHAHRLYRVVGVAGQAVARHSAPAAREGRAEGVTVQDLNQRGEIVSVKTRVSLSVKDHIAIFASVVSVAVVAVLYLERRFNALETKDQLFAFQIEAMQAQIGTKPSKNVP